MTDPTQDAAILAFLRARVDEDEASEWPHRPSCQRFKPVPADWPGPLLGDRMACDCDVAQRWAYDIDAKRRAIEWFETVLQQAHDNATNFVAMTNRGGKRDQAEWTMVTTHGWEVGGRVQAMRTVAESLTRAYAGHPDYDESWRP